MPDRVSEHGSGVAPVGEYVPGSHAINPSGLSKNVRALPSEAPLPPAPPRRKLPPEKRKPGRPVGSKNRPPPTEEMFDGPPDTA